MGLWKGISASLVREATYSSIRLGLYEPAKVQLAPVIGDGTLALKVRRPQVARLAGCHPQGTEVQFPVVSCVFTL